METKDTKQIHWLVLSLIFSFGWVLIYFDRTMLNPIIIEVLNDLQVDEKQIGLIFSTFFLGYTLFQIPGGLLGEKIGINVTIKLCFFLLAIVSFFSTFSTSFMLFVILRALSGGVEGIYYGPQFAYSSKVISKKHKVFATTIINSGMSLGIILGTLVPTVLVVKWGMPYKYLFVILSVVVLILLAIITRFVPNISQEKSIEKFQFNKELGKVFFISFCSLYAFFHILTWLPLYLSSEKSMSAQEVAYYVSLIPAIAILSALLFSRLVDKYKKIKLFTQILVVFTILSIIVFTYSNDRYFIIIALIAYGVFGKLALDPIMIVATSNASTNKNLSTTLAVFNFVSLLSSIFAPIVGSQILARTGSLNMSFLFSAILLFIAFIVSTRMKTYEEDHVTYSH